MPPTMRFTSDPRVRQTLNQISDTLESANQRTQTSLFTFSQSYVQPGLSYLQPCCLSVQECLEASCQPCCSARDDIRRHRQPRYSRRGRERAAFDFYDDWDEEEEEWGNDEMDRLLAGDETQQPGRHSGMSYGTRGGPRRRATGKDPLADDPTLVPQSSVFGFLERLPWKIGGRGTRYRPSPANLRANIGKKGEEGRSFTQGLEAAISGKRRRPRSSTTTSRETTNSLSSRGDIFPSDDEDDAREIDEEFALALGRKSSAATSDEISTKRKEGESRASTKTASSKHSKASGRDGRAASTSRERVPLTASPVEQEIPSLADLKREEEEVRIAEEAEIEQRRTAAQKLAYERGLSNPTSPVDADSKEASIVETSEVSSPADRDRRMPVRDSSAAKPARDEAETEEAAVHDGS